MKSLSNLSRQLAGVPLLADDVTEFHAARIILLLNICGINGKIDGLTKLAKLDFFARYPEFFNIAAGSTDSSLKSRLQTVESHMVRHHYGPWDKRYYKILAYLKGKELVEIRHTGKSYEFILTTHGLNAAHTLSTNSDFHELCEHMANVGKVFGRSNGTKLKKLIYAIFDKEVAQKRLGQVIGNE